MSIDFTKAHTWNKCPRCGKPVPPNEWASYMRCEDCWAEQPYNPPQQTIVGRFRKAPGRLRADRAGGD